MRKTDKMKVKLQEVLEALEGAGMEIEYYYCCAPLSLTYN